MSLVEALEAASSRRKGPPCTMGDLLNEEVSPLSPEEREALAAALADTAKTHASIGAVLREHGHWMSDATVRRHRNSECKCHEPR